MTDVMKCMCFTLSACGTHIQCLYRIIYPVLKHAAGYANMKAKVSDDK